MIQPASYPKLSNHFTIPVETGDVPAPTLLAWNGPLANELGLDVSVGEAQLARIFSGAETLPGMQPLALAYAGHQFGHFVPQLGDGRAALLGEAVTADGRRVDLQLKGSGPTPFSRGGDGRSALGPVLREYVVSEAMHALGVPTTRALAAVATGRQVLREDVQPGAVFTRVASSHLRVGSFEFLAARGDSDALRNLLDYAIDRHYPDAAAAERPAVAFLKAVADRQAALVARWMSVGFIHGVMNTDNTSISGETLDYGPCAFMDEYRHDKVFSSIDRHGRYAYSNQAPIAQWNLARLAECLLVIEDRQDHREVFESIVMAFLDRYEDEYLGLMRAKLGFAEARPEDASLVRDFLDLLEAGELDYTLSFRRLAETLASDAPSGFGDFTARWRKRLAEEGTPADSAVARMNSVNPLFIPRNHRIEEAIRSAVEDGDLAIFRDLNVVLANPFEAQAGYERYAEPPAPSERVTRTFCGT